MKVNDNSYVYATFEKKFGAIPAAMTGGWMQACAGASKI